VFEGVVKTKRYASQYDDHYAAYPATRSGFDNWLDTRDSIDAAFYDALDLAASDRKY
jgi:hypothetical protein